MGGLKERMELLQWEAGQKRYLITPDIEKIGFSRHI